MSLTGSETNPDHLRHLTRELENFRDIAQQLVPLPGEVPTVRGFDIWGGTLPLAGPVGGDHITYIDFKHRFDLPARIDQARAAGRIDVVENLTRCQHTGGIALLDVSGHRMTDALLAAMLHQAFLLGTLYELDRFGQITRHLFENLNTRFYPVLWHEQVRLLHLWRDLRGREVPLSLSRATVSDGVFQSA